MKQTASTIRREYPVVVAPYDSDSRYRRVWMRGVGWVQLEREEFELRIRRQFPDIDMDADDLEAQLAALEATDQTRLGPVTPENVAKLPMVILNRISEELTSVADPT